MLYGHDQVVLATSEDELQKLVHKLNKTAQKNFKYSSGSFAQHISFTEKVKVKLFLHFLSTTP
jgi:hypothetical protein